MPAKLQLHSILMPYWRVTKNLCPQLLMKQVLVERWEMKNKMSLKMETEMLRWRN